MAPGGNVKILFCILFITCCCTVAMAQIPMDCCFSVKNQPIHKTRVVDYRAQISGRGCALDATIVVTRHGRTLCVPADKPWVHKLKSYVDKLKKDCRKNNQNKLCNGVTLD